MFKVDIQVPIPHTCMLKSFKKIILSELMKPILTVAQVMQHHSQPAVELAYIGANLQIVAISA